MSEALIRRYYAAFNAADWPAMLDCLTEDVVHDINQGGREIGREAFAAFLARMERCYRERVEDLVVMLSPDGLRGAAEFTIHGSYLVADEGLPPAHGQNYVLPVGAFFELRAGRIARVSNFYNLPDWIRQVSV
jgi:steroid delta-isomerase-like uncharacterized protein